MLIKQLGNDICVHIYFLQQFQIRSKVVINAQTEVALEIFSIEGTRGAEADKGLIYYLPLRNRNVMTRACGALILAPYLRDKHRLKSVS